MSAMNSFQVWIRPLGNTCRVRVDGVRNALWLLGRLGHLFVFKTAEPMNEEVDSSCCTFRVEYGSRISRGGLERLLGGIPEVVLMTDPA
ncbi:MAG: hypothetical protein JW888_17915 [Pirellulales bacterium]|nr:hypothetical protein [Pirellulales bacterium]